MCVSVGMCECVGTGVLGKFLAKNCFGFNCLEMCLLFVKAAGILNSADTIKTYKGALFFSILKFV